MPSGLLKPTELKWLKDIVDHHCKTHGIRSADGRESVAMSALGHYKVGVTSEGDLLEVLAREDDPERYIGSGKANRRRYNP